jgi:hypothetical protein
MIGLSFGGTGCSLIHSLELILDFLEHVLGGVTDGLHGHSREPVGEHGANKETGESEGLEDVDVVGFGGLSGSIHGVIHGGDGVGDAGHEGTEEGQGDEAGGADSETLADSGGGVACSVEVVSVLTDGLIEVGHLGDSTSVVGDGTVAVNGEGNREAAEHTDGSKSDTVHGGDFEGDEDGGGEAEDGDNGGDVTEGESVDDVGGSTVLAGDGEVTGGAVFLGGVVLGDEADEKTGPESEHDADVGTPHGGIVSFSGKLDSKISGEDVKSGDDHNRHEDGGDPKLDLELELDGARLNVGEELADEGSKDTDGGDDQGEVDGFGGLEHRI